MARQEPLDTFLDAVATVLAMRAGTAETSFYPAIHATLNAAGDTLDPKILCLHHPSGAKAGIPDFGLFERTAFRKRDAPEWRAGIQPERGVVEVKPLGHDIAKLAASEQVRATYLPAYGLILITNLRQWRLLDEDGIRESFDLAPDDDAFRALARGSRPNPLRRRFADFLQRCLLWRAPLNRPKDVAFFLASYARDALALMEERATLTGLDKLREAMESALGIAFKGEDGEHLFRSTLVQTLFYGLFSAWAAHAGPRPFDWRAADYDLHLPVVRLLYNQVRAPQALKPLGLEPLLDAATATLARVDRGTFFTAFGVNNAVQYFYEPFLEFFDPALRKQLGVWYTPSEIVEYMVERVDRVLREELGRADGLADEDVWVLDPCCGTGSFVVEVLRRIRKTLEAQGLGDRVAEKLKQAATTRVVGFEIMTAPLIIAHWQVGQMLREAPLAEDERAAIYLTNALTGWAHNAEQPEIAGFDELLAERTEADAVKRNRPILVVLGNPPYNAYAGTAQGEEAGLVDAYKLGLQSRWGVRKFNLDDLFVRFFRVAERRIAQTTGKGIVCFITNYSWLSGVSFTVMRESLLNSFDRGWFENMHGDRTITEYGPDGRSSETVFAIEGMSVGIRQGVAISLLARTGRDRSRRYLFRDDINASAAAQRRADLLLTLDKDPAAFDGAYTALSPSPSNRFALRPGTAADDYGRWAALPDLSRIAPQNGLMEKRGGALIDDDRAALERRMRAYFDASRSFDDAKPMIGGLGEDRARFDARATRAAQSAWGFDKSAIRRYWLRPFDLTFAYISEHRPLWNEPRPQLQHLLDDAQGFLLSRPTGVANPEGQPTTWTPYLADDHGLRADAYAFAVVENLSGTPRPNLSDGVLAWLVSLRLPTSSETARQVWYHALAVTYSPAWLAENAEGIRQGWPRVPLPNNADLLAASAALGAQLAALLDPDTPVPGVTTGTPRPALAAIAVPSTAPGATRDWTLTGWGHISKRDMKTGREVEVVQPGRGRTDLRPYAAAEAATEAEAALLGAQTRDVWLNGASYWRNIPDAVWETHIGGYQVIKKWLSYRDASILGRPLSEAEIAHVQHTARRLAAIRLMGPALDASFRACAAAHTPLPA